MKRFLATLFVVGAGLGFGVSALATPVVIKGEVLEVKEVDIYSYLLLKTDKGEVWTAVGKAPVKKGAVVTVEDAEQMDNFESKVLKKTFPKIYFGSLAKPRLSASEEAAQVASAHAAAPKTTVAGNIKVAKATGAGAQTVAELITKSASLKDKPVLVRAQVVKFSAAIMGKNWVHLRDGTGTAANDTNDVLATSQELFKVGDVVQLKGVLRTNVNLGSGYTYQVMLEDAKLQK
ncbi:nucleotide-binding protein [Rhodoferax sp.]|uniref:nucleotide-binding protein n=1 Tax=Rhodoferax sp. TaxID=50421 RepID=UPI0019EA754F|nr:nucleotide-binding protein [Rhodoferax sp.]MBE0474745.1 nucleotide-binding protein [Rhodoferax sp.]